MNEREPDQSTIPTYVQDYLESNDFIIRPELGEKIIFEPGRTEMILVQKTETGRYKYTSIKIPSTLNETKSVIEELSLETGEPTIEKLESLPTIPEKIDVSMVTTDESPPEITHTSDTETNQDSLDSNVESENNHVTENMIIETEPKDSEIINSSAEKLDFDLLASLTQTDTKPKTDVAGTPNLEPKPVESNNLGIVINNTTNDTDFWADKLGLTTIVSNKNEQNPTNETETKQLEKPVEPVILDPVTITNSPVESVSEPDTETKVEQIESPFYPFVTTALLDAIRSTIPNKPDSVEQPTENTVSTVPTEPSDFDTHTAIPVKPEQKSIDTNNLSLEDYQKLFTQHSENPMAVQPTAPKVDPVSLF